VSPARPYFSGVDVERSFAEPDCSKYHHRATQYDQQQSGDVTDNVTSLRQGSSVRDALAIFKNRSNFWTRKPNAIMAIAVAPKRGMSAYSLRGRYTARSYDACLTKDRRGIVTVSIVVDPENHNQESRNRCER
jgi:hypothetical protein